MEEDMFCDFNYSGWSRETLKVISYQKEIGDSNLSQTLVRPEQTPPWYLTKALLKELEPLIRKQLPTLINYLVQNHPALQKGSREKQKGMASDISRLTYIRNSENGTIPC
eukprot:TRINITY_DN5003_c0_g1_i1.p1 TRINITY_DN5003_c0_g1~~TRINITY_DN5003_c0_g1_i1.p1  ORF type:complete len:110 (+),score=9.83 TRINITY_DN5003_c0_g1_i1:16-345(+)